MILQIHINLFIEKEKIATTQNIMDEYLLFEVFERGDYIPHEQIKKIANYVSGQLKYWSPDRSYYEAEYNYATKLYIVCDWKKTKGLPALAKKEKQFVTINL